MPSISTATTVAAILLPGQRTPALHQLTSDIPTILRVVERVSGRRVLVETAWQYRHHAFLGPAPTKRQRGAPAVAIDIAWHAQRRLHRPYRALAARGKPKQHIAPPWHANSPASSGPH